jgi:16S rRNA (cytosine1402-N4)-methyltransferase
MEHRPVLRDRVVELLVPGLERGGVFVDATLGRGGHARAVLAAAPSATLIGIDRDPDALAASRVVLRPFLSRTRLVRGNFEDFAALLERLGVASVAGVLFDLGVSSPQLDDPARGFSFRADGPLDMRMDPTAPLAATDIVNGYEEDRLAGLLGRYGEERFARRIVRAIVAARPVTSTGRLAEVVASAVPAPARRKSSGHPARRTFQALRIAVNGELDALERALPQAVDSLEPGGRLCVLSYHSLEDRFVKRTLRDEEAGCVCPPDFPVCRCGRSPRLRVLTPRPLRPGAAEQDVNPRSSAAKLRAARRVGVAAEPSTETRRSA